jgi:hypothetical protein
MGLITENNKQYYAGSQSFLQDSSGNSVFTTTFDTDLVFGSYNPQETNYALNNFKIYTAAPGDNNYTEYIDEYSVVGNTITIDGGIDANTSVVIQLKTETGGNYGNRDAYGGTVQDNWGSYAYTKLNDVINNFIVAYVGAGKLIPSAKRTDVIFHAKRAMQEFSYDTLKSVNSQELTIPSSLSVPIPQDYVNYTNIYYYDQAGIKHLILPNSLSTSPFRNPIQDSDGIPTQDNFSNNIEGTSVIENRWENNDLSSVDNRVDDTSLGWQQYYGIEQAGLGQRYGMNPQFANNNGWFLINERDNKFSFSSDLVSQLITLEYISDGLSTNLNTRIPKLAEEALYAYISHAIISTRINQPEYVVNRLKKEKSAKLRNAKIRLSNLKMNEFTQVMRGKSKWLKH